MSASSPFFVCSDCLRHVRRDEPHCPFCEKERLASLRKGHPRFAPFVRRAVVFAVTGCGATACAAATPAPSTTLPSEAPAPSATPPSEAPAPPPSEAPASSTTLPSEAPASVSTATEPNRLAAAYGAPPASGPGSAPATTAPVSVAADRVVLGAVAVSGGVIDNANDVVAAMHGAFSRCYDKSPEANSNAAGEVAITIKVGLAGQVLGVAGHRSAAVPASLMACLTTNAATADFHPPTGAKTAVTVAFPVTIGRR